MFGPNTLSLPTSFAHEHRQLRLNSDVGRPQPTGQCHYQLIHPSANNQICACQVYQHNRGAPGNVCDCGHSACYHSSAPVDKRQELTVSAPINITEKMKRLEDMILAERQVRDTMMLRERQLWEREIRILREALAPFYKTEEEMQRKLLELEERIDNTLDDQLRIRDRLVAMKTNMVVDKQTADQSQQARRSPPRLDLHRDSPPSPTADDVPGLTSSDDHSSQSSYSRHQTPSETLGNAPYTEADSPRSSGILNLVSFPRPAVAPYIVPRRISPVTVQEEPRSSGFLGINLKEHLKHKLNKQHGNVGVGKNPTSPISLPSMMNPQITPTPSPLDSNATRSRGGSHERSNMYKASATSATAPSMTISPPSSARQTTPRSLPNPSPPVNTQTHTGYIPSYSNDGQISSHLHSSKKRKCGSTATNAIMALEVLADVSAASSLIS